MNWRQLVGIGPRKSEPAPQPKKPIKEKLSTSGLGAGFLEIFRPSLQSEKNASEQLIKSFYGWVYANVSAIAEAVSKIEPELYKVRFEKGQIVYDRVLQHPVLDLLDKFNTVNTASEAFYVIAADLELVGDMFLLKNRPIQPTEMYLLDPTKVTVNPRTDGFGVLNYEYKRVIDGKTETIVYKPELILPIKHPNPENPLRGKSTVAAAALTIDTSNLASEFLKQFFANGAIVNFALSSEQRITNDEIRRIQMQLKKEYGGPLNAFKALILGGGFKVEPVQHTNKEMQIIDLDNAMRDKIMAMFKNTKASLGIVEDVNRANAEASLAQWKEETIKPKMMRVMDALNEYLVPDYGNDLVLCFKDPVPENRTKKVDEVAKLMANTVEPVITVNEARSLLGMQPIADKQYDLLPEKPPPPQPFNNQDQQPKSLSNVSLERHLRRLGVYDRYERYKAFYGPARDVAKQMVTSRKKTKPVTKYANYSELVAMRYWAKQMSQLATVEHRFTNVLDQYLQGIEDKAVSALHENATKTVTKADLVDQPAEVQTGIDLFTPLLQEIAQLSGVTAYELLNISKVYTPTRAMEATIKQYVELMANSVVGTDTDKLESILTEGLSSGSSIPEIESQIRAEFADFRKNQSERIARTEVLRASNAGALDAYKQSGVVQASQWYTAEDDRVDEECAALDGKIITLGGSFYDSDYGSGEEPPLHPNCRCTLLPVVE